MFIQTEDTPNPATLKFIPGVAVLPGDTAEFTSPEEAKSSPLATRLLAIDGVESVFFSGDFLSVTKIEQLDWFVLKPSILAGIMEHFASGLPVIESRNEGSETEEDENETVQQIKHLLDTRVRPAVAMDGGDITFILLKMAWLHCRCVGPVRLPKLHGNIENGYRKHAAPLYPEVREVRPTDS